MNLLAYSTASCSTTSAGFYSLSLADLRLSGLTSFDLIDFFFFVICPNEDLLLRSLTDDLSMLILVAEDLILILTLAIERRC
jgi:hypothetical protein